MRRESTDVADLFVAHIGVMDTFARGLKAAAAILEEDIMPGMVCVRTGQDGDWKVMRDDMCQGDREEVRGIRQ